MIMDEAHLQDQVCATETCVNGTVLRTSSMMVSAYAVTCRLSCDVVYMGIAPRTSIQGMR